MYAAVIEYPIKNDFYPIFMTGFNQFLKCFLCSERRINLQIIRCSIFVIKIPFEYGIQIQAFHSKRIQVFQIFQNSGEIASHIILSVRGCSPFLTARRIIRRIPISKAFRENLIINNSFCPFRNF